VRRPSKAKQPAAASDAAPRLAFVRFLAELLDQRFTIPGTSIRIGLDPIIGLIPGIGDALANLAGSAILLIGAKFNLPKVVLLRMALNIAINTLIGAIPFFGDLFSIWFRSNVRNVQLLERYASQHRQSAAITDWLFVFAVIGGLLLLLIAALMGLGWLIQHLMNF
jgi:signal transduction histidine kinase